MNRHLISYNLLNTNLKLLFKFTHNLIYRTYSILSIIYSI